MSSRSGYILRRTPAGRWQAEVSVRGRRRRRNFAEKTDAVQWATAQVSMVRSALRPPDAAFIEQCRIASLALPPGVTIADAVRIACETLGGRSLRRITLADAIKRHLDAKSGLRPRSATSAKSRLADLKEALGRRIMSEITLEDLLRVLEGHEGLSRNHRRTAWIALWREALAAGNVLSVTPEAIPRAVVRPGVPPILSVAQAGALMRAALDHGKDDVAAWFALGLFAGIRSAELERLRWDAIGKDDIMLDDTVAKRRSRIVAIEPNLAAWLGRCRGCGPVAPRRTTREWRRDLTAVREAAGIEWTENLARHSFATYHAALHGDWARTAAQLGHPHGLALLLRHYRAAERKAEAEKFFGLRPENVPALASRVIAMAG